VVWSLRHQARGAAINFTSKEHCARAVLRHRSQGGTPFLSFTLLRHPIDHTLSLFMHCKHNPDVAPERRKVPKGVDDLDGLGLWLRYFKRWQKSKKHDFECYNPINIQARYMVCDVEGFRMPNGQPCQAHGHSRAGLVFRVNRRGRTVHPECQWVAHHIHNQSLLRIDSAQALAGAQAIDVVGITEFYPDSMCLLMTRLGWLEEARTWCDCSRPAKPPKGASLRRRGRVPSPYVIPTITHNVPKLNKSLLTPSIIRQIRSLSPVDHELYCARLGIFASEVTGAMSTAGASPQCMASRTHAIKSYTTRVCSTPSSLP